MKPLSIPLIILMFLLGSSMNLAAEHNKFEYYRGSIDTMKASFMFVTINTNSDFESNTVIYGVVQLDNELIPYYFYKDSELKESEGSLTLKKYEYDFVNENEKVEEMSGKYANGKYIGAITLKGNNYLFAFEKVKDPLNHQIIQHKNVVEYSKGKIVNKGDFSYSMIYPQDSIIGNMLLSESLLRECKLSPNKFKIEIEDYEKAWSDAFMTESAEMISQYSQEELDTIEYLFGGNRGISEMIEPYVISNDLLIYQLSSYIYLGGAHGMNQVNYIMIDPVSREKIKTFDVLNEKYIDRITNLIDKQIRKRFNINPNQLLQEAVNSPFIVDSTSFSEVITVSKKGITFHYAEYQMTPYAYGQFQQFVPMEHLLPYLTEDFKKKYVLK